MNKKVFITSGSGFIGSHLCEKLNKKSWGIVQAFKNDPITIFEKGNRTRSFCYFDDLVKALMLLK
jgi:nucleoside-diphosphate-sugar epimerase